MDAKTIYFHTLSPLHVGAGRGTGLVDLPIVRERATNFPILPGSSVKGVIRDYLESENSLGEGKLKTFFGEASNEAKAGAVSFSDAYVLCLPVRAFKGTFAWVTCPQLLTRLKRDQKTNIEIPEVKENEAFVYSDKKIWSEGPVVLEDLDLSTKVAQPVDSWCNSIASAFFKEDADWIKMFKDRFVVVSDAVFDFLAKHATEVRARIRIDDETKIVQKGALWYEESLPAETLLAGLVWQDTALARDDKFLDVLAQKLAVKELQFGGKASTGLGRMLVTMGA